MKPFNIKVNSASNSSHYDDITFHDYRDFLNWLVIQKHPVIFYPPNEEETQPRMMLFDDYID